jgi:hypothetical protein
MLLRAARVYARFPFRDVFSFFPFSRFTDCLFFRFLGFAVFRFPVFPISRFRFSDFAVFAFSRSRRQAKCISVS